jgi:hypothetical protein
MNTQKLNSGIIPETTKTYSDLELALASLYKAFHHHTLSADSDIREEFYQLNGYLNSVAVKYGIRKPNELKNADAQWYIHAVSTLQDESEVHAVLNSFMVVFKITEMSYLIPISNHVINLLKHGLVIEMNKN